MRFPLFKKSPAVSADDLCLTFPDEIKPILLSTYTKANVILEYGSGGSTMMAAELGKQVTAIESDLAWANKLQEALNSRGHGDRAQVVHVDIGKTGKWGKPVNHQAFARYHRYPMAIWDQPNFRHPDVILVDGRLRAACLLTAVLRISKPTVVLFDDYVNRPQYHFVEKIIQPSKTIGRLAIFSLTPGISLDGHWAEFSGSFAQAAIADG